ncbi:MAG: PAS domain-containing protein [Hyphomicrobiales bacterium]
MITKRQINAENPIRLIENQKLFDHWQSVRFGPCAAKRRNLNMRTLAPVLGHIAILERNETGDRFHFRLAGTELRNYFGQELTGLDFLSSWGKNDRAALATVLKMVLSDAQPAIVRFVVQSDTRRSEVIEALFLPMAETGQLLASFAMPFQPYWIGSQKIAKQWVLSIRTVDKGRVTTDMAGYPQEEFQPNHNEPVVLVSTDRDGTGNVTWPGFKVIPGGRK